MFDPGRLPYRNVWRAWGGVGKVLCGLVDRLLAWVGGKLRDRIGGG